MKTIRFLRNATLIEIILSIILGLFTITGVLAGFTQLAIIAFTCIAIVHTSSMILHWLAWNMLPTTQKERIFFNIWVMGAFAVLAFIMVAAPGILIVMLFGLLLCAFIWYNLYCYILIKEYLFLTKKLHLYEQRELIHF